MFVLIAGLSEVVFLKGSLISGKLLIEVTFVDRTKNSNFDKN